MINADQVSWVALHSAGGASCKVVVDRAQALADLMQVDVLLHFNERFWWFFPDYIPIQVPEIGLWPKLAVFDPQMVRVERKACHG